VKKEEARTNSGEKMFRTNYLNLLQTYPSIFCAWVGFLLNTTTIEGQTDLFNHSHFITEKIEVFKTSPTNHDELHYRPKVEVVDEEHVYVFENLNTKKRTFSIIEFQIQTDSIEQKRIYFHYPRKAGVHPRADVSTIRFDHKSKKWIFLVYDKILIFDKSQHFEKSVPVSGKWSDLAVLENGNFLLSYYYPYGAYLSPYNHELAILDKDFQLINEIHPPQDNIALATFDKTDLVATNGDIILHSSISKPKIFLLDNTLKCVDSLSIEISYDTINYDINLKDSFSAVNSGCLKLANLQFINKEMAIISYFTSTTCTGEILLNIKSNKITCISEKIIDAYNFWYFNFSGKYTDQMSHSDIEWYKQNSHGTMFNNKLYHVHEGESVSPVGLTNKEINDLKNIPNLSGSVYFYFAISKFDETPTK
jgi:hypothetical protein